MSLCPKMVVQTIKYLSTVWHANGLAWVLSNRQIYFPVHLFANKPLSSKQWKHSLIIDLLLIIIKCKRAPRWLSWFYWRSQVPFPSNTGIGFRMKVPTRIWRNKHLRKKRQGCIKSILWDDYCTNSFLVYWSRGASKSPQTSDRIITMWQKSASLDLVPRELNCLRPHTCSD